MKTRQYPVQDAHFLSLWDYLGNTRAPDGVGKLVFEDAKACGVPMRFREVSTRKYTGKIAMYPKAFLTLWLRAKGIKASTYNMSLPSYLMSSGPITSIAELK